MRALILAALLAAPAGAQLLPQNWKPVGYDHWGGLNLLLDSTQIEGDAQTAQNVLTDNGYLEKRPGNVLLTTVLPGSPVQYVNDWSAPNGSRYLIMQASQTVYQTNFSGAAVALSTIVTGFNLTTVPAFSKLEFADGFRPLWYWNDTSTATVTDSVSGSTAPVCTYIAFKDSRIWCANLPSGFTATGNTENGGGSSTVLISSSGGDGYWAVPSNVSNVDNAPNRFDFNPDDGDGINCLATTPWGEFVGKRNSSYIVKGNGNLSYDPRILDPKIGCVDNRSVQMVYGVLQWLAVDGVYGYDGSGPPRLLTRELDPLMALVRESSFSQGQWATQLQPDWASGTTSTTTGNLPVQSWDFNSVAGEVFPSSFTLYDDNRSPSLEGGAGFSSDTLVNIDTVSVPLSVGYSQIGQNPTGGILISSSNFSTLASASAANLAANGPGWKILEGVFTAPKDDFGNGSNALWGSGSVSGQNRNTVYSVPASTRSQQSLGMMYGTWSVDWNVAGSVSNGQCAYSTGECMELAFINTIGPTTATPNTAYTIRVDQTAASGTNSTYSLTLNKYVATARTTLATYSFHGLTAVVNLSVSRTPGGEFSVYFATNGATGSGALVMSAADSTASISSNVATSLTLYRSAPGGVGDTYSGASAVKFQGYPSSGTILSRIYDTGMGAPFAGILQSTYTAPTGTTLALAVRSSTDSSMGDNPSFTPITIGSLATLPGRYWQYESTFTTTISSATPTLTSVSLAAITTGYYYSKVDFIGSLITAWRQFAVTESNPGVYAYAVRQATYNFSPSDTSIAWVAQTANVNVNLSVSTPTYAQFRLDSTTLTFNASGATASEPITAVFLRWNQGANLPVASDTLERRYMLCVTVSTTATAPDTCLLRQKNGKWVTWNNGGTIGAMGLYNNQMVAADGGTSSKVWEIMQNGVYNDDSTPIDMSWVSEDFTDGVIFNKKILHEMWFDALPVSASSVTISYQVDKSSGYVDSTFSLDRGQSANPTNLSVSAAQYGSVNQFVPLALGYDTGKYIRVKFEDDNLGSYTRINSYLLLIEDQGRRVP